MRNARQLHLISHGLANHTHMGVIYVLQMLPTGRCSRPFEAGGTATKSRDMLASSATLS